MGDLTSTLTWVAIGAVAGVVAYRIVQRRSASQHPRSSVVQLLRNHFHPVGLQEIAVSERRFPYRVRADIQRSLDRLLGGDIEVLHFCGVNKDYDVTGISLSECCVEHAGYMVHSVPPQYEDIDVGDDEPVRCLKSGLWLLRRGPLKFALLLSPTGSYCGIPGIVVQVGTPNTPEGVRLSINVFQHFEDAVLTGQTYRGKILSLEQTGHAYSGEGTGIRVHKLRPVDRDQVVLSRKTLDQLDRNIVEFVKQRPQLAQFQVATKKGILFYGPPGTGKTHTIHYLAKALPAHTTLLVTAEQVGLLDEYMALARLLQPSVMVLEDVDLIARHRENLDTCQEVLLNKLLNEMDGLREEADILFILTTNRPEMLERALASRPGRIDQAIEFDLPDAECREKLVRLYSGGIEVPGDVLQAIVSRTEKVSAAFIKELMRRSLQFHLESNGSGRIGLRDVESALDEMLFSGGALNLKLLGATGANAACVAEQN